MRVFICSALLLFILALSLTGCGGGGGGGGGGSGGGGGGIITASINTSVTAPTSVSTISISGVSNPIICGINLKVTYPSGTTYVNGVPSGVTPVGTILDPVNIGLLDADVTLFGVVGFGSGEIAKINYATVPLGSLSANFGVTILKVFDCNGVQIQ